MKRTALILMTMLSVATLVGCGGTSSDDTSTSVSSSEDIPTEEIHQTKIVTYDGPSIMETSANVAISVNDNSLFVYETRVNHGRVFTFTAPKTYAPVAYFDFVGSVTVKVEILNPLITLSKAVVRPLYLEIDPQITENVIEFTIDYPADYTIEFNDDTEKAIHLFANPLEVDPIDPEHIPDDVTYIGPGAYSAGAIPIASNKTIYLAGGAFVYGQIRGEMLENVTIRGRGILSGAIYDRKTESESTIPLEFRFTNNIQIDGISILDPAGWAMLFYNCENVLVNDVKIITARANGDGISVQGSRHVDVIGGFVRTWDDSLVVKNMAGYCSEDVYFKNVVIWTDLAQSMEIGFESRGEYLKDIVFENITILHNFHKSAMSIHLADDALVSNVTYRNITLEDGQMLGDNRIDGQDDYFIDISIEYNIAWSTSGGELGSIAGVHFENVKVHQVADSIVSRIRGDSDTSTVSNVSFRNVDYAGVLEIGRAHV